MEENYNNEKIEIYIPRWKELPNIELYMDQLIYFIDDSVGKYVNIEKDGHVLTKTMINNYVKNSVIKPTNNKKYNKEHIARLIVISMLKQIYSLTDISNLIDMATKNISVDKAYDSFCTELEYAIKNVFGGKDFSISKDSSHENYILKRVVLSFANKLYVDKVYLKKY